MSRETEHESPLPTLCPFCQSNAIGSAGAKITAESYWRCEKCGQVWNPGRLRTLHAFNSPRR